MKMKQLPVYVKIRNDINPELFVGVPELFFGLPELCAGYLELCAGYPELFFGIPELFVGVLNYLSEFQNCFSGLGSGNIL